MTGKRKDKHKRNRTGGSAGGGGFNYQAAATAFVSAHILAKRELGWFSGDLKDIPFAVASETGGPGDDIRVRLDSSIFIEAQAKHGLQKGENFWQALMTLSRGLSADRDLRAVLLVDSTASLTIRDELRSDVVRVSQGRCDDLKSITVEFISKLTAAGLNIDEVFSRLRIVVLDLYPGSMGESVGRQYIGQTIADSGQAQPAWSLLVKDGLDLITHRGHRDASSIARYLQSNEIVFSRASENAAALLETYCHWIMRTTEKFQVAGFDVALPISSAWVKLNALHETNTTPSEEIKSIEKLIAQYHEWERLADKSQRGKTISDAEFIADFAKKVVIIGGPGAGKSTLLKRLAHRYAAMHKNIVRVRLPVVLQRMKLNGERFEDAIISAACDGSGISLHGIRPLLAAPDYFIADGLDECDPQRLEVADLLSKWAIGHEKTTVLVTTRAIGHDPSMLPGWKHYELLPLSKQDTFDYAEQILSSYYEDSPDRVKREKKIFEDNLEKSSVASLAARNPLLLGFLIQLSVNKLELGRQRASLFEQVINLMGRSHLHERASQINIESSLALRALSIIGWIIQNNPAIDTHTLFKRSGAILAEELQAPILEAERQIEIAFKYWEERRLLERLTAGGQEAVAFVHLALGEYAAALFAANLSDEKLFQWLVNVRKLPRWRETILLSAGSGSADRIIRKLIELDNSEDPTSTEALLAASCQSETDGVSSELSSLVADRLTARLSSQIPVIAYESGRAAMGLARLSPAVIGPLANKLLNNDQRWTKLIATTIALLAGKQYVNLDILERDFESMVEPSAVSAPGGGLMIKSDVSEIVDIYLSHATDLLLAERKSEVLLEKISRIFLSGHFSLKVMGHLREVLIEKGCRDLVQEGDKRWAGPIIDNIGGIQDWRQSHVEADKAVLEAIITAFAETVPGGFVAGDNSKYLSLSALYQVMRFGEIEAGHYLILGKRLHVDLFEMAIRGAAAAAKLAPSQLVAEATSALSLLREDKIRSLFDVLLDVTVDADWGIASKMTHDPAKLAMALNHPSEVIGITAAQILVAGAGGLEGKDAVEAVMSKGGRTALWLISTIAPQIWNEMACAKVLSRLEEQLTRGCEYLFQCLPKICDGDKQAATDAVTKVLLKGIMASDADVAEGAAEACAKMKLPASSFAELKHAYNHWKVNEAPYPVKGGVIPTSPRKKLLRAMLNLLDEHRIDDLLIYYSDVICIPAMSPTCSEHVARLRKCVSAG